MATLTIDPTTASAVALIRRPRWVMHRRVPSARCSATHGSGSGLLATWPANDWSFPLVVARRRSWGSRADAVPFTGLIPRAGGRRRRPPVRAHVPLSPSRPPRLVFVGVIRSFAPVSTHTCRCEPLAQVISSSAKDTDRGRAGDRLLGFSSRLRSARRGVPGLFPELRLDGRSCLGLRSSFRVCGHGSHVQPRGLVPARITNLRPVPSHAHLGGGPTHPLVGFERLLPDPSRQRNVRRPRDRVRPGVFAPFASSGPSAFSRG